MTTDQKKVAKVSFIALILLAALCFAYFKWIKPQLDKKKEAQRLKDAELIASAMPPAVTMNPGVILFDGPPAGSQVITYGMGKDISISSNPTKEAI